MTKQLCESCKGLGCAACGGEGHIETPRTIFGRPVVVLDEMPPQASHAAFQSVVTNSPQPSLDHETIERAVTAGGIISRREWRAMLEAADSQSIMGLIGQLTAAGWSVRFCNSNKAYPIAIEASKAGLTYMAIAEPCSDRELRERLAALVPTLLSNLDVSGTADSVLTHEPHSDLRASRTPS